MDIQSDLSRIAELSDEELSALEEQITADFDAADQTGDETVMQSLAEALDIVLAEKEKRAAAVAVAPEGTVAASAADDDTEGSVVTSPEVPESAKPITLTAGANSVVAGADIPGVPAGTVFTDRNQFTKAFAARLNTLRRLTGGDGEQVIIASVKAETGADQTLFRNDPEGNSEKIRKATSISERAVVAAAGQGWCSPLTTRYDIFQNVGVTTRPVRGALTGFNAERGGIRYFPGFSLGSMQSAVGIWDQSNDPTTETKNIGAIDCPPEETCEIYAVTMAMKFSNMVARAFPEQVDAANDLVMIAHARLAESTLLAAMMADSTRLTGPTQTVGSIRQILRDLALVAAYYRDRHRLAPETPLRTILPSWILEAARGDIVSTGPDKELLDGLTVAEIEAFFSDRNVNVTWTLDSPITGTNNGGFYGPATTAVPITPATVGYPIFVEGSFLFLDGGTLDLGIVRDSGLVQRNEFIQFAETFEGLCHVGGEALWITSNVVINGQFVAGTQTSLVAP